MEFASAAGLRQELNQRALTYAKQEALLHAITDSGSPSVIFGRDDAGLHGNFHHASYRQICSVPAWSVRLDKVHTASRRMSLRSDWRWRELDCACSSDALLMNIFCHPLVLRSQCVQSLLAIQTLEAPAFGYKPRVPFLKKGFDQTEVDMKLGDLLIEAKLTETDFQCTTAARLLRYRDLEAVFGWSRMHEELQQALDGDIARGYQVIRGILAANATGGRFCLLCDARRRDLIEIWYAVLREVKSADLRCRIMLLTWQELASRVPRTMQKFLEKKYGILGQSGPD